MLTRVTRYYVVAESDYPSIKTIPIHDDNNNLIAYVNSHFFADTALEGTGKLSDGRIINVTGNYTASTPDITNELTQIAHTMYRDHLGYVGLSLDGSRMFTYSVSPTPWGIGIHNRDLVPFVSCASDQAIYPFGTILYIAALKDQNMPDGTQHMGYIECIDVGSAIKGQHIDLFVGYRNWAHSLVLAENVEIEVYNGKA